MSGRSIQCRITVRGRLAPHWSPWLGALQLTYRAAERGGMVTDLIGTLADQNALQAVLNQVWRLNLTVLEVRTVVDAPEEGRPTAPGG